MVMVRHLWLAVLILSFAMGVSYGADFKASYSIPEQRGLALHIIRGESHYQWWDSWYNQHSMERRVRDAGGFKVREYMKEHPADWVLCALEIPEKASCRLCAVQFDFVYIIEPAGITDPPHTSESSTSWSGSPATYTSGSRSPESSSQNTPSSALQTPESCRHITSIDYVFTEGKVQMEVIPGHGQHITLPNDHVGTTRSGYIPVWIAFPEGALALDHDGGEGMEATFDLPDEVHILNNNCD